VPADVDYSAIRKKAGFAGFVAPLASAGCSVQRVAGNAVVRRVGE
jgi:hypothetical protein